MKLADIKSALVDHFFSKEAVGINRDLIDPTFIALGEQLNEDLHELIEADSVGIEGSSLDPSKAFKRFTDGRNAMLSICEDDGNKQMVIFAAVRVGKRVVYEDLTLIDRKSQVGDLSKIKTALKHAKKLNEDAYFVIKNEDKRQLIKLSEEDTPGLKLGSFVYDDKNRLIYVAIGDKRYAYTSHIPEEAPDIFNSITGMAKHSPGKALSYLKKHATGKLLNEK